jgi:hypothetical protein
MTELKILQVLESKNSQHFQNQDEYIGVVESLSSPFTVFVKLSDLSRSSIRFITYSAGKHRVLLWGLYHTKANQAEISNSCKYGTPGAKLSSIVNDSENRGFQYVGNVTKNRISATMARMQGEPRDPTEFPEKYRALKYYLQELDGKIKKSDIDAKTLELIQQEHDLFVIEHKNQSFEDYARNFVDRYEAAVNLQTLNTSIQHMDLVKRIVAKITNLVKFGHFYHDTVYNELENCPLESSCELSDHDNGLCDMWSFGSDEELEALL